MAPEKLGERLLGAALLPDRRDEACSRQLPSGAPCPGKLRLQRRGDQPTYRCSGKGCCQTYVRLTEGEEDVFADGLPLRLQVQLLWQWCAFSDEPEPQRVAMMLGIFPRTVRKRFDCFRQTVGAFVERALATRRLGGWDASVRFPKEVEVDEVLLRSRAEFNDEGTPMIRAVRYCGLLERGNPGSLQLLPLPDRVVAAGGGGPISNEELLDVLRQPDGNFRILPKTIIHTDSAKAYFNLGWKEARATREEDAAHNADEKADARAERHELERHHGIGAEDAPQELPLVALVPEEAAPGPSDPPRRCQEPEWAGRYRAQKWIHTAVVHTKKQGKRRQFACRRKVVFPTGKIFWVMGGTQGIDGHWKRLKNAVTRSAINTRLRGRLRLMTLSHLWRHWAGGECRFTAMGKVLADHRAHRAAAPEGGRARTLARSAQRRAAANARKFARPATAPPPAPAPAAAPASAGLPPFAAPSPTLARPRPSSAPVLRGAYTHPRNDPVRAARPLHGLPPRPGRRVVPVTAEERASVQLASS